MPNDVAELTEKTLISFCQEFVRDPYLCYTEHGLHALFFNRLHATLDKNGGCYAQFGRHKVCLIQKEYPTHRNLGRSRRQHWDIAVLKHPLTPSGDPAYDHFRLAAVIEMGLNCDEGHLLDDIQRLTHTEANLDRGFLVHLDRFSDGDERVSGRDWNSRYTSRLKMDAVKSMLQEHPDLSVFYGIVDQNDLGTRRLWKITAMGDVPIDWQEPDGQPEIARPT